jgi:hypothetical protein
MRLILSSRLRFLRTKESQASDPNGFTISLNPLGKTYLFSSLSLRTLRPLREISFAFGGFSPFTVSGYPVSGSWAGMIDK